MPDLFQLLPLVGDPVMATYPHLPDPDLPDEHPEASWRLSSGERVWAAPGVVCVGPCERQLDDVEDDARVLLEAVAWARGEGC